MMNSQLLPQSMSKSIKIHHQPDCLPIQTLNPCTECWVRLTHGAWGLAWNISSYCLRHHYRFYSRKIHHIALKQFHLVNVSTSSIAFTHTHLTGKGRATLHRAILGVEGRSQAPEKRGLKAAMDMRNLGSKYLLPDYILSHSSPLPCHRQWQVAAAYAKAACYLSAQRSRHIRQFPCSAPEVRASSRDHYRRNAGEF